MGDNNLFFYGTLIAPAILHRVIHGPSNPTFPTPSSSYVRTCPALLHSHRRHRVKDADYPAVIPASSSSTVRGTFATGLTDADLRRLDIFEGDEYERRRVKARKLLPAKSTTGSTKGTEEGVQAETDQGTKDMEEGEEVEADTYIWIAGEHRLEEQEWDFETFKRDKMRFWIGGDGIDGETGKGEFERVDQQDGTGGRGVNGDIGKQLEEHQRSTVVESAV